MSNKKSLKFFFDYFPFRGISGIAFSEGKRSIVASFKLQGEERDLNGLQKFLVLKIVYKREEERIRNIFDNILSRYGWKELELEDKPGHIVSFWKVNCGINRILREVQEELLNKS